MNPETIEEIDWHLEVRYDHNKIVPGWCAFEVDKDGRRLGYCSYFVKKSDAMTDARRISADCVPIKVYDVNGEYQCTEVGMRRLRESKPD